MVCTPGNIWGKWIEEAYKRGATGEAATFRERKRMSISCAECGVTEGISYLKRHMERQHGGSVPQTTEVDMWGGENELNIWCPSPRF